MTVDGDDYSSILLHVGTNLGHLATFKILPEANGRYNVQSVGSMSLDDRVIYIAPLNADSGRPAYASQTAVGNLRNSVKVNGVLVAVTPTGARIFKPATTKGAHKTWDTAACEAAAVV
ncbi:Lethal(2) giant larvae sro7, partial [Cryomyces antarcticus]